MGPLFVSKINTLSTERITTMKITDICESTTAGSIATVAAPMTGGPLKRSSVGKGVYGKEPAGSMFTGKKTSKPFANSKKMNEAAGEHKGEHLTVLYIDNKPAVDYTDITKAKKELEILKRKLPNKKLELKQEVREAKLEEDDLIIVPGQGHRKGGFISRADDRRDHEVEMARGDLYQAHKNSSKIHKLIKNVSEDDGLEGWVQAKITKAADYLNSVRQYLEGKKVQEMTGGVIAGGGVGEGLSEEADLLDEDMDVKKLAAMAAALGFSLVPNNVGDGTSGRTPADRAYDTYLSQTPSHLVPRYTTPNQGK